MPERKEAQKTEFKQNLAFVIGIEQYKSNRITNLRTAVDDATRLSAILKKDHGYEVELLTNEQATRDLIKERLEKTYKERLSEHDRFLFYFAGHGTAVDSDDGGPRGYLMPHDAISNESESFLSMHAVNQALSAMACRHLMVILDSCFSGTFRWSATRNFITHSPRAIFKERYERFVREPAWQVITSASHDEEASDVFRDRREKIGNHSPFALALFEALEKNEDANVADHSGGKDGSDGVLTALELYQHLEQRVQHYSKRINHRQTPEIWPLKKHGKGQFIFHVGELNLKPAPRLDEESNPYRGLNAYDQENADTFFGRDAEIEALYNRVQEHVFTVVLGASGTGKSSLVKAGLLSKLHQDESASWRIFPIMRPGPSPLRSLQSILHQQGLLEEEESREAIRQIQEGIQAWCDANPGITPVFFIDQFEELYTMTLDESEREAVMHLLATMIEDPRLRIIITLRSDFEAQFTGRQKFLKSRLKDAWAQGRYIVPQIARKELIEAIERPASSMVVHFEAEPEDLVDRLVEDVVTTPGSLPWLSFVLSEMYARLHLRFKTDSQVDRALTWADYKKLGGVTGALRQRAVEAYEALTAPEQASMQLLMLRMVTLKGGNVAKQRVLHSDLIFPDFGETARIEHVRELLTEARLLVGGVDEVGEPYAEPAHDALVKAWDRLIGWVHDVNEEEDDLLFRQKLAVAAREWEAAEHTMQKRGLLWADEVRARLLEQLVEDEAPWMNKRERAFSEASVNRLKEEEYRALLFRTSAIVLEAERNEDPLKKALLISEIPDTLSLHELGNAAYPVLAMMEHRIPSTVFPCKSGVRSIAFSPVDDRFVTGLADGRVRVWSLDGTEVQPPIDTGASVESVAFNAKGDRIVTAFGKDQARIWPLAVPSESVDKLAEMSESVDAPAGMGEPVNELAGMGEPVDAPDALGEPIDLPVGSKVLSVSVNPVDDRIITGSKEGRAIIWSSDGKEVLGSIDVGDDVLHVSFSPGGDLILTGTKDGKATIWSLDGEKLQGPFDVGRGVWSAAFSPRGNQILTGLEDDKARIWALDGKSEPIDVPVDSKVLSVCYASENGYIVTGSEDGRARIWPANGNGSSVELYTGNEVRSVCAKGDHIITGSEDGNARLWSLKGSGYPAIFDTKAKAWTVSFNLNTSMPRVWDVSFSPDDNHVVVGTTGGKAHIWPLNGEEKPVDLKVGSPVLAVSFSPERDRIATGSSDGRTRMWSLKEKGKRPLIPESTSEPWGKVHSLAFIPGTGRVVVGSGTGSRKGGAREGRVFIWPSTGEHGRLELHEGKSIRAVACNSSGTCIAAGAEDGKVYLWSVDGKEALGEADWGSSVRSIAFNKAGDRLAAGLANGNVVVWVWDGKSTRNEQKLDLRKLGKTPGNSVKVNSLAFSPSGDRIAIGSSDGNVRIWVLDGKDDMVELDVGAEVNSVAFNSTGDHIVAGAMDGSVRMYCVTWKAIHAYFRKAGSVASLSVEERQFYLNESLEEARENYAG